MLAVPEIATVPLTTAPIPGEVICTPGFGQFAGGAGASVGLGLAAGVGVAGTGVGVAGWAVVAGGVSWTTSEGTMKGVRVGVGLGAWAAG